MKNLKRIVCLVLAIAVVCGLGITAFAASEDPYQDATADVRGKQFPDVSAANHEEAIYALVALGVFEGYPDGQFKPDRIIERDEFAKIVFYFCGNDANDVPYFQSMKSQFPDVAEGYWAEGYINYASLHGFFIGYPDGEFKSNNQLTMQEAVTVLLRVLGYTDDLKGVWPNDYNRKAVDVGLTDYVDYIGGAPASRDVVAQLSYNTLDCYKVTYIEDKTVANVGYLSGGAIAVVNTLYTDYKATVDKYVNAAIAATTGLSNEAKVGKAISGTLGYINMYGIDDEQYAYMYGRTNEGEFIYYDLLAAAFGATKVNVHFYDLDNKFGNQMIESAGWYVENRNLGTLGLEYYTGFNRTTGKGSGLTQTPLASTYYLVGGDLVDLGDTVGRVLMNSRGEAIMAATGGRVNPGSSWRYSYDAINRASYPFYSNYAYGADYYDNYTNAPYMIFAGKSEDRLGYTTVRTFGVGGVANVQTIRTADIDRVNLFYNMSTGKFIKHDEIVPGDVIYNAGLLRQGAGVQLNLVYNAANGNFTELTNNTPFANGVATIDAANYTYSIGAQAVYTINGGAAYAPFTYDAINAIKALTTMSVAYVPAYRSTQLVYLSTNITPKYTYPVGVVTGYTYGDAWEAIGPAGQFVHVRTYSGVTIFNEQGETVSYEFERPFDLLTSNAGTLGDLVTLELNADGKVANWKNGTIIPENFTTVPYFVDFAPSVAISSIITTNAAQSRVTIQDLVAGTSDIYTLASDAVIFLLTTNAANRFASVKLVSAADFLAGARYQSQQYAIYKGFGDNNTITGLYLVNCVDADRLSVGLAVKASILEGKSVITLVDGSQFEVVGDGELFNAYVPSFIAFKINADGKMFDVQPIARKDAATGTTEIFQSVFNATYGAGGRMVMGIGTFQDIYKNSIVDNAANVNAGGTLFMSSDVLFYNFNINAPTAVTALVSDTEAARDGLAATNLVYVYDSLTHELAFVFVVGATTVNP